MRPKRTDHDIVNVTSLAMRQTHPSSNFSGESDEDAQFNAIKHVIDEIEAELKNKGVKCDQKCDAGECYVDIEPSIAKQLWEPKPQLKFNPATATSAFN
jgi:hypothetical protein